MRLSFPPPFLTIRWERLIEDGRDIPTSEFEKMMDINLKASFLLVKGVVGGMKDRKWGRIIFISSIAAYGAGINGCRTYRSSTLIPLTKISTHCHRLCSVQRRPKFYDDESLLALGGVQHLS